MILVNGKNYDWIKNMNIFYLLKIMGYTLKSPPVLINVNTEVIPKAQWETYTIPENAKITVINLLRGG